MRNNIMKKIITIALILFVKSMVAQPESRILKSSSGGINAKHDMFGWQVSHNNTFMFSSAPHDDDGVNKNTGAVYVFTLNNKQVVFKNRLHIQGAKPFSMFGKLIAHTDDFLVVTAQRPITTSLGKGYVYLYKRIENNWNLVGVVADSVCKSAPTSIQIEGNTIAAGYSIADQNNPHGFIMIFQINPDNNQITLKQKITVDNLKPLDLIGHHIGLHQNMLAFSSISSDGNAVSSGSVWVYKLNNNTWDFLTEITHTDATSYDHFGYAIAINNPFIAIGAPRQGALTETGKKSGAVYVYKLTNNNYNLEAKLQADAAANDYDYFGSSLDLENNLLAVGAHSDDFAGRNTGAVYLFERAGNSWTQINKIIGSNVNNHALFGSSISLFNGSILCSSHLEDTDSSVNDHGAIYYYENAKLPVGLWNKMKSEHPTISVYPNPASEYIHITSNIPDPINEVSVYDIKGNLITHITEPDTLKNNLIIYCKTWKTGVYIISINNGKNTYNQQLIKE